MFPTCPLPPLLHNEKPGTVTLMRCAKATDYRRQRAACSAPGNPKGCRNCSRSGEQPLPSPSNSQHLLHSPCCHPSHAPLLTFSSAFCTRRGCDVNCHRAGAMFIALPVANPAWRSRILPANPQGSPLRNCRANKNHGG